MHQQIGGGQPPPYRSIFIRPKAIEICVGSRSAILYRFVCRVDGCELEADTLTELHLKIDRVLELEV